MYVNAEGVGGTAATAADRPSETQVFVEEHSALLRAVDKVVEWSLLAIVVLSPVIFSPPSSDIYELPKALFTRLLTIVIIAAWGFKVLFGGRLRLVRTKFDLPLVAYLILATVSSLISISPTAALYGLYQRDDGLLVIITYALLFWIAVNIYDDRAQIWRVVKYQVIIATGITAYAVAVIFGIIPALGNYWELWPGGRAVGSLGHPSFLSTYLGMAIPLGLVLLVSANNTRGKILWGLASGLMFLGLLLSYGRSGWFGVVLACAFLFLALGWYNQLRKKAVVLFSIAVPVLFFAYFFVVPSVFPNAPSLPGQFSIKDRVIQAMGGPAKDVRTHYWQGALKIIKENWLIGVGVSQFPTAYMKVTTVDYARGEGFNTITDKAHNEYLHIAATTGIPSLLFYLWFLGTFVWLVFKKRKVLRKDPLSAGLVGAFIAYTGGVTFLFSSAGEAPLYWWAIGATVVLLGEGLVLSRIQNFRVSLPPVVANGLATILLAVSLLAGYELVVKQYVADHLVYQGDYQLTRAEEKAPDLSAYTEEQLTSVDLEHGSGHSSSGLARSVDYFRQAVDWWPYQEAYWDKFGSTLQVSSSSAMTAQESAALSGEALKAYNSAIRLSPETAYYYAARANIYASLGEARNVDALNDFRTATRLGPYYYEAHRLMADLAFKMGNTPEGIAATRRVLDIRPDNQEAWYNLAAGYFQQGRQDSAEKALLSLLELKSDDVGAHTLLGRVYLATSKKDKAEEQFGLALKIEPDNEEAKALMSSLLTPVSAGGSSAIGGH